MFCCHQLHKRIQLFWIKELRPSLGLLSPLPQIQFDPVWHRVAIVPTLISHPFWVAAARGQFFPVLEEGKRKCLGWSAELLLWGPRLPMGGPSLGAGPGISIIVPEGACRSVRLPAKTLEEAFFVLFVDLTWKAFLWKKWIYTEK